MPPESMKEGVDDAHPGPLDDLRLAAALMVQLAVDAPLVGPHLLLEDIAVHPKRQVLLGKDLPNEAANSLNMLLHVRPPPLGAAHHHPSGELATGRSSLARPPES